MVTMIIIVKINDNTDIYLGIILESSTGFSAIPLNVLLKDAFRCYCY